MPQSRQKTRRQDLSSVRRLRMKSFRLKEWSLFGEITYLSSRRYSKKQLIKHRVASGEECQGFSIYRP